MDTYVDDNNDDIHGVCECDQLPPIALWLVFNGMSHHEQQKVLSNFYKNVILFSSNSVFFLFNVYSMFNLKIMREESDD